MGEQTGEEGRLIDQWEQEGEEGSKSFLTKVK